MFGEMQSDICAAKPRSLIAVKRAKLACGKFSRRWPRCPSRHHPLPRQPLGQGDDLLESWAVLERERWQGDAGGHDRPVLVEAGRLGVGGTGPVPSPVQRRRGYLQRLAEAALQRHVLPEELHLILSFRQQ